MHRYPVALLEGLSFPRAEWKGGFDRFHPSDSVLPPNRCL